jgi:hypothetical protein
MIDRWSPVVSAKAQNTRELVPNSELYVTASQIDNMPRFNNGKSKRTEPYKLWKVIGIRKSQ